MTDQRPEAACKAFAVHAIIEERFAALENLLAGVCKDYNEQLAKGEDTDAIRARMRGIENRILSLLALVAYSEKRLRESAEQPDEEAKPSTVRSERTREQDRHLTLTKPMNARSRPCAAAAQDDLDIVLTAQGDLR